jgi:SAM-dependent methyltransferase
MNEAELKRNASLNTGYTVHDLNRDPTLSQHSANTFDAVICSASIDYLIHPLQVFEEIGRILKPTGQFITSFSNRCFPSKVIGRWLKMNEQQRVEWVANYFFMSRTHFDSHTIAAHSLLDDKYLLRIDDHCTDPMYVVLAKKKAA